MKNNLQTVAALLRLQARRLPADETGAREALAEAERRIGSIAVVHETLSQVRSDARRLRRGRRPGGGADRRDGQRRWRPGRSSGGRAPSACWPRRWRRRWRWCWSSWCRTRSSTGWTGATARCTVEVQVAAGPGAGDRLTVTVADDGAGLPGGLRPGRRRRAGPADRADPGRGRARRDARGSARAGPRHPGRARPAAAAAARLSPDRGPDARRGPADVGGAPS